MFTDVLGLLGDLDNFAKSTNDTAAITSVGEARTSLEKLIGKMDSIESGFDRIAERSCGLDLTAH
jgi:autophagy-related protein 11